MKRRLTVIILVLVLACMLALPAQAAENNFVTDISGALSQTEWARLEARCSSISELYDCGVYVVITDYLDELGYGSDSYVACYSIYNEYGYGIGSDRDGIMLLIATQSRDHASFVRGQLGEYAFDEYGVMALSDEYLSYFSENRWYEGVNAYVEGCGRYLAAAAEGDPVRESNAMAIVVGILIGVVLAFIICKILKAQMQSVHKKGEAAAYVVGGLSMREKFDQYTHTTTHTRKIEKSSSGSRSGGGGHGSSGKF